MNIKSPEELYQYMRENIKYGFISNIDNKAYRRVEVNNDELYEEMLKEGYFLQTPEELNKSKYGLCYDQVEFARKWFVENNYEVFTFFSKYHNHSFIIYKDDKKYYLFERTFPGHNGIYEGKTLGECLVIYKNMQFENADKDVNEIKIYPYNEVKFGIDFKEYKEHASSRTSEEIILTR